MSESRVKRLLGEFVVIVVGVLVALGVDEWREDRRDRDAETHYVQRLIRDLEADSANMTTMVAVGETKAAALDSTLARLSDTDAIRRSPSLALSTRGLAYTYARPQLQTTSFDELTATGGLSLIRDDDVRYRIGRHYRSVTHHFRRLDDRRTRLAWMVADLFPEGGALGRGPLEPEQADAAFLTAPNVEARFAGIFGPEYQGLLNQERIYAYSMTDISTLILEASVDLLATLREYDEQIR